MVAKILRFFVIPFSKIVAFLSGVFSQENDLTGKDWEELQSKIRPGHIILSVNSEAWPSNLVQKISSGADWFHAVIVFDKNYVIESVNEGVVKTHIFEFLKEKDKIVLLEPTFTSEKIMQVAARLAASHIGAGYDWAFSYSNVNLFYCSELIYKAYDAAMAAQSPFTLRKRFGVETIIPQDFIDAKKKFKILYKS
jgi:uncharacterized protein YycO